MSYKKWNKALLDYYFTKEGNGEILLYCDEDLINLIGKQNSLGNINDFIDITLTDSALERKTTFENFFGRTGSTTMNRKLQSADGLKFSTLLYDTEKDNGKISLAFFNFIILSILTKTVEVNSELYSKLNGLQNPTNYDFLFKRIEEYNNRFVNRRIGKLRYEGLIKYQVVLSKKESLELDSILYNNSIFIHKEEQYESILNRVIPYTSSKLRDKFRRSYRELCFAMWLENKIKGFNHETYTNELPHENANHIQKKTGQFAFSFKNGVLHLLTNIINDSSIRENNYFIDVSNTDRIFKGNYSLNPILYNDKNSVEFKSYSLEFNNIEIKSLPINEVTFLQYYDGFYLQTLVPEPNIKAYAIVKNNPILITKWENWCSNKKNTDGIKEKYNVDKTSSIFGINYIVYLIENIKKPYLQDSDENFYNIDFSNKNSFQKTGGFMPNGMKNTYLDVALPYFKINIIDFDKNKFQATFTRTDLNKIDKSTFKYYISNNDVFIFIDDLEFYFDTVLPINVNFSYNGKEIHNEEFEIICSTLNTVPEENLFKQDRWGKSTVSAKEFFNGISLKGSELINLNSGKKIKLAGLKDEQRIFSDYFINLLAGYSIKNEQVNLCKDNIKEIINHTINFYNSKNIILQRELYSDFNLIENLLNMGYINREVSTEGKDSFQLCPPTFTKIERSFTPGGSQVYKLSGCRTREFSYKIKKYCSEHNIEIKYKTPTELNTPTTEYFLLPDMIFVDHSFNFDRFKETFPNLYFIVEKTHNVGSSLLNYISSVQDFENKFIKDITPDTVNFNIDLEDTSTIDFPRIRIQKQREKYTNLKRLILEYKEGSFYRKDSNGNWLPKHWMELFVKFKTKQPILLMESPKNNNSEHTLHPKIYFDKYSKLPSIISKALVDLNQGIATEKKVFLTNDLWKNKTLNYVYNVFLEFNISDDKERREKLCKILTGDIDYLDNDQIIKGKVDSNFKMTHFHTNDPFVKYFRELISISNESDTIIAFASKKSKLYISSDLILQHNPENRPIMVHFKDKNYEMFSIDFENINDAISTLLTTNKDELNFKIKDEKHIVLNLEHDYIDEEITIMK
jgi:hypothetical protein